MKTFFFAIMLATSAAFAQPAPTETTPDPIIVDEQVLPTPIIIEGVCVAFCND